MLIVELYKLKQENNFEAFYKRISTFISGLKNFTNAKLNIVENQGLIDKDFYTANDILDEVFLDVFDTFSDSIDEKKLRSTLFIKIIQKINEKEKIEQQFSNSININTIVKEELDLLSEKYTVDAGGDFILDEELDDISYKQKSFKPTHFILDENITQQIYDKLGLEPTTDHKAKELLGVSFYNLPPKSRIIIELYIFGNQSIEEIKNILLVKEEIIEKVIEKVIKRLTF